ncbi:MAG: PQQ-dependent sugar dehydrogenase [Planctomycetota bacterium]
MRLPLTAALLAVFPGLLGAQTLPPGFTYQLITDNSLIAACAMAFAPDGRLFICERHTGNIRIVQYGVLMPGNWATVPCAQFHPGDHGFLGIAIDPGFLSNGYVYVYYTTADALQNRIARLQDVAGSGTGFTILSPNMAIPTGSYPSHNGGRMVFSRDGTLFVGTSDRTDQTTPQNMASWCGKVLRFNVPNLTIPANNPFPGNAVYSLGHRSQFGLAIRPATGDLYNTEVGDLLMDEMNRIVAGGNYGWPMHEGTEIVPNPATVDPLAVYFPTPEPTGVTFYNGTLYPQSYRGSMFFTEFTAGGVRKVDLNAAGTAVLSESMFDDLGQAFDIQMGPDGHLWVLHNDTPGTRGADEIGRYVYTGEPNPGINAMVVCNHAVGGAITYGLRGNVGDLVVAWVSLSAFASPVPTPYGPMWVTPDYVFGLDVIIADDHTYIPLPVPNSAVFTGQTIYAQGASIDGVGNIATTANYGTTVMW